MAKKNLKQIILFLFNLWHKLLLYNNKNNFCFMPLMEMQKCLAHYLQIFLRNIAPSRN